MTTDIATPKKIKAAGGRVTATRITSTDRGYARTAVRLKVARAVWELWNRVREEQGVDQTWLVERLGSNKGHVSRLLNGSGNWTLDTLADLLEAMEGRITLIEMKRYRDVDAGAGIMPSVSGMHDNPGLWNVIVTATDDDCEAVSVEIEARAETLPALRTVSLPRVISREIL